MAKAKQLRVEYLALKKLLPYARNARTHSDEQVAQIAASIKEFGFTNPILLSKGVDIIAGHGRALAAASLKLQTVPCIRLGHLSESQRKAYALADNRLALNAGWDLEMLSSELKDLQLDGFDLDLLGFDSTELEDYLAENTANAGNTDPDAIPENVETRCKLGELWQLGAHRLLCGDSTNVQHVERLMGGEKADMVFTDPPYGVDYDGGTTKRTKLANDHDVSIYAKVLPMLVLAAKDDAAFFIWFAMSFSAAVSAAVSAAGLVERKTIIWNKNLAQFGALSAQYKDKYEPCTYAFKKGHTPKWFGPTNEVSVWDISRSAKNEFHPTQKPVELSERAIGNHTKPGMALLDLFLGSGSTLIACEKTGRRCFGMEIDPHYCDVILKRWEDFSGKKAKRIGKAESEKGAKKVASRKQGRTAVRDHGSASA